jgi:hypothetical protein
MDEHEKAQVVSGNAIAALRGEFWPDAHQRRNPLMFQTVSANHSIKRVSRMPPSVKIATKAL